MIKVYEVWINTSEDGRGPSHIKARFLVRADAERCARGASSHGSDGSIIEVRVFESWDDMTVTTTEELRKSALKKLTLDELKALGLERLDK